MTNRHNRRALERLQRSHANNDATAMQARVQAATNEVQRLNAMLQTANQALMLANQILVEKTEGEVSIEDDPNFFRTAAIEDFTERCDLTRVKLIGAIEELYLSWASLDPADQPLVRTAPTLVTP